MNTENYYPIPPTKTQKAIICLPEEVQMWKDENQEVKMSKNTIMSNKELKRLYEFTQKHPATHYIIHLIQTGIGTKIVIENNCYQEDVSDYDAW